MDSKKSKLLEGSIVKSLFTLTVPIVFANILQAAYQFTDAFWVGRLGGAAVASVSVSFPITFLLISLGVGFAVAGSTLIAQYVGARNKVMVNRVAAQTLLMVVVISIVLGGIGYLLAPTILNLMGVAPDVFIDALGFMRVSLIGLVFIFGFAIFQSIMRGVGQVKMPMFIVLGTVILNFALDPLFIFGWGTIAGYGVMGAAIATFITEALAAIIGFYILLGGKFYIHLKISDFKPDFTFIKKAFFLGLPASIEQSARALGMTAMTFLIASFGTLAIATYGVASNIVQLVIILAMGFSMAISVLVGQNIGAGNVKRAAAIARLGAIISFVILSIVGAIVFIFAPYFIAFFVPGDPSVIQAGAAFVRIIAFTFGLLGVQMALSGVFRASGNMVVTMTLALISQWVLLLPVAYLLSKHTSLGVDGLWWAFPISNVIMVPITIIWYAKGDWKNKKLTEDEKFAEQVSEEIIIEEGVR